MEDNSSLLTAAENYAVSQWLQKVTALRDRDYNSILNSLGLVGANEHLSPYLAANYQDRVKGAYVAHVASAAQNLDLVLGTYSDRYMTIVSSGPQKPPEVARDGMLEMTAAERYMTPLDLATYRDAWKARAALRTELRDVKDKQVDSQRLDALRLTLESLFVTQQAHYAFESAEKTLPTGAKRPVGVVPKAAIAAQVQPAGVVREGR
jgi:hypothetical protein